MTAPLSSPPSTLTARDQTIAAPRGPGHYLIQLDALRAFAVMAVMFDQFYGRQNGHYLPWGEWGVQLFFVLSGFLITGILLRCRGDEDAGGKISRMRQFYVRRFLRIFPLFYAVLFAAALLNVRPVRETLLWHVSYLSNLQMALAGGWSGPVSHFWSLAVEEQFYLLWPCLILFLPRKYLLWAILIAIATGPIYKTVGAAMGLNPIAVNVLMFGSLDFLGIGALLAWFGHRKPLEFGALAARKNYLWAGAALGAIVMASSGLALSDPNYSAFVYGEMFGAPLLFVWLVHQGAVGVGGPAKSILEAKPLLYLGQISYGLYIFHKFLSVVVPRGFGVLKLEFPENPLFQLVLLSAINVALASLSWFVLERPINRLKTRFPYFQSDAAKAS